MPTWRSDDAAELEMNNNVLDIFRFSSSLFRRIGLLFRDKL